MGDWAASCHLTAHGSRADATTSLPAFDRKNPRISPRASNVGALPYALANTMTKKLLFVMTILLALAVVAAAADVTGKWTYEQQGRGGGPPTQVTITLKQDGSTLTGTVPGFGRGGGTPPPEQEISNGKVDGDKISFEVKRERQGQTMVTKYEGTVSGSELKLKITRETPNGPMSNDVVAKKAST